MNTWALLGDLSLEQMKRYEMGFQKVFAAENIKLIASDCIEANITGGKMMFQYNGEEYETPDAFWTLMSNTESSILERILLANGAVSIINQSETAITRSKALTIQRLDRAGIRVPRTEIIFDKTDKEDILKRFSYPFIIKPDNGFGGEGVALIQNEQELDDYLAKRMPKVLYNVQEFISTSKGRDVRVVMLGGEFLFSKMRVAADENEFRSNIHQGGELRDYEIDERTLELCRKIAALFDLPVVGIDLMFTEGDFIPVEVNSFPGMYPNEMESVVKYLMKEFRQKGGKTE